MSRRVASELIRRALPLVLLAGIGLIGAACGDDDLDVGQTPQTSQAPQAPAEAPREVGIDVVASTQIVAEWVAQVGGERVSALALVPPETDAHTFELSPDNVRAVAEADLVVINGGGLEAAYEDTIEENLGDTPLVELSDWIALEEFPPAFVHEEESEEEGEEEDHGRLDPHFWLDPDRAIQAVQAIRDELSGLLPDGADEFATNASRYIAEIEAADAEIQAILANLPAEKRVLVTFHDAFGYFARRYDLEVFGFVIEGPEQEPSAAELADLIEAMWDRSVTRVYREPQFESSAVDRVADETGAEVRVIYSQPIGEVESYTDLLRANGRALAE